MEVREEPASPRAWVRGRGPQSFEIQAAEPAPPARPPSASDSKPSSTGAAPSSWETAHRGPAPTPRDPGSSLIKRKSGCSNKDSPWKKRYCLTATCLSVCVSVSLVYVSLSCTNLFQIGSNDYYCTGKGCGLIKGGRVGRMERLCGEVSNIPSASSTSQPWILKVNI